MSRIIAKKISQKVIEPNSKRVAETVFKKKVKKKNSKKYFQRNFWIKSNKYCWEVPNKFLNSAKSNSKYFHRLTQREFAKSISKGNADWITQSIPVGISKEVSRECSQSNYQRIFQRIIIQKKQREIIAGENSQGISVEKKSE